MFSLINNITKKLTSLEEAIMYNDELEIKELDKRLYDLLEKQLDLLSLVNHIVEIEDFIKENYTFKHDFADLEISSITDEAARKIQNVTRAKFSKKQKSASYIQSAYKKRINILTNNLELGELLCHPPNKETFNNELKRITNNSYIISNLKLLYCKMGNKNLSLIKEINNTIFLNNSFNRTNLENIKFNNVKFYSGFTYSKKLEDLKIKNIYAGAILNREREIMFVDAKFKNNEFNNCKFIGKFIHDATVDNLKFIDCLFENIGLIQFSTIKRVTPLLVNPKRHTFALHKYNETTHKVQVNNHHYHCAMFFDNCHFIAMHFNFFSQDTDHAIPAHFKRVIFTNVKFHGFIDKMLFENCIFISCTFEKVITNEVTFSNCDFIKSNFINTNFYYRHLLTYITDSRIHECVFHI